jgi:hypothetical protein
MRDHADVSARLRRYLDGEDGPVSSPDGPTSAPSVGPTHLFRVRRPSALSGDRTHTPEKQTAGGKHGQ